MPDQRPTLIAAFAWLIVYLGLGLAARADDQERNWTDIQGRTMRAQFIREVEGDVTFLKEGKLVTLPLEKLSEADRKVIRELEAGKAAEAEAAERAARERARIAQPPSAVINPFQTAPQNSPSAGGSQGDSPPAPALRDLGKPTPSPAKKTVATEDRIWTNLQGKQTKAKFLRMHDKDVILMRAGRTVTAPFESLTRADQDYVHDILAARGEESLIPHVERPADESPPAAALPLAAITSEPPPVNPGPLPVGPGPASEPVVGRGNSAFFEKMRERDEQQRRSLQEQNQRRMEEQSQRLQQQAQRNAEAAQQAADRQQQIMQAQQDAYHNEIVGECSNCKKPLTRDQGGLKNCPHCGVVWEYEVDKFGNKREIPGAAAAAQEQSTGGSGFTLSSRGKVKLFTRVIIPGLIGLATLIFGAMSRGRR